MNALFRNIVKHSWHTRNPERMVHNTRQLFSNQKKSRMSESKVANVPKRVPMAFTYRQTQYYIRESYVAYYKQIQELIEGEMPWISVTGTPGIGKSVFYFYVFERMRKEYPNMTFICASFSSKSNLKECIVFYPDGKIENCTSVDQRPYIPILLENAIHLYDGPPKVEPRHSKMVTFTSPNHDWFEVIRKEPQHCKLFMPIWTFDELLDANDLLNLGVGEEQLQQAFGVFGGVARYCLQPNVDLFENAVRDIVTCLSKVNSYKDVKNCLLGKTGYDGTSHRIFYCMPLASEHSGYYFRAEYFIGSKWIAARVRESVEENEKMNREALMRQLRGLREAAALFGWLFEQFAHETFVEGGEFDMHSLLIGQARKLRLDAGSVLYNRFSTSKTLEFAFSDIYMIPDKGNFESVDSFYYRESESALFAFQMTTSLNHNIKAHGLMKLLELAGKLDLFARCEMQLVLVFVVPKNIATEFKKQQITMDNIPSEGELDQFPIEQIKGVGRLRRGKELRDLGITTGQDLWNAERGLIPDVTLQKVEKAFLKSVRMYNLLQSLCEVNQLCLPLEIDRKRQLGD